MINDPIEELLREHKTMMAQVADLRTAVAALEAQGEAALAANLPVFARISRMMVTELDLHRHKEDDVLFPALEAMIGSYAGPTAVMRYEHQMIHEQGELLRQTLHELNEVQHPAIEAGATRLHKLVEKANTADTADALRVTGQEIIELLDMHFTKEEQILFPMASNILDEETLVNISRQFRQMAEAIR